MTRGQERALQIMVFVLVSLTWIPFRAPNQDAALAVVSTLFRSDMVAPVSDLSGLLAMLAMTATVAWHMFLRERRLERVLSQWGNAWQTVTATGCLMFLFLFSGGDQRAFIYFQF